MRRRFWLQLIWMATISVVVGFNNFYLLTNVRSGTTAPVHSFIGSKIASSNSDYVADVPIVPLHNAQSMLQELLSQKSSDNIVIEGYVVSKRGYGNSFCFLDVAQRGSEDDPVQCMLKRQEYNGEMDLTGVIKCISLGLKIRIEGCASPTKNPGEVVLLCRKIDILKLPRNPQRLAVILRAVEQKLVPAHIISSALNLSESYLLQEMKEQKQSGHLSKLFQGLAKVLVANMIADPEYPDTESGVSTLPKAPDYAQNVSHAVLELALSARSAGTQDVVSFEGIIHNRRRFRGNVTILEIEGRIDKGELDNQRVKCILHPQMDDALPIQGHLAAPESYIAIRGVVDPNSSNSILLWATHSEIIRASWRPASVLFMLESAVSGEVDVVEASKALGTTPDELLSLMQRDRTARQWKAAEISKALQTESTRIGKVDPMQIKVLESFNGIAKSFPVESVVHDSQASSPKEPLRDGSRWKRKKEPQLEWMRMELQQLIESHVDFGKRPLRILDVGGGQGLLANHLASSLSEVVEIHVVDIAQGAIKNGARRSRRLQLPVQYTVADASKVEFSGDPFDFVVALHSCGVLTDVALGLTLRNQAGCLICPCCFQSNTHLRIPLAAPHTSISVHDWLNVSNSDYFALTKLAEVQGDLELSGRATHVICALRARAVEQRHRAKISIAVKSFPLAFSTRNLCLVGTPFQ